MSRWLDFTQQAPEVSAVFARRHAAAGQLCMLATLRPDGFPRISPMEPRVFEGDLWLGGMPGTAKFRDLARDPRFGLHTATVDPEVGQGDAKLWGSVEHIGDPDLHQRFAEDLFVETGFDLRGETFESFLRADVRGAASVRVGDGHLDVTTWREGGPERVIRKH